MIDLSTEQLQRLTALCREFKVGRLDLFGSGARADFDPVRSDLDFLVEFLPADFNGAADRFFGLQEGLAELFSRPVDLVDTQAMRNPYFIAKALNDRTTLYAA